MLHYSSTPFRKLSKISAASHLQEAIKSLGFSSSSPSTNAPSYHTRQLIQAAAPKKMFRDDTP